LEKAVPPTIDPRATAPAVPAEPPVELSGERSNRPLPVGYRQGLITAITVFIGFSLSFLRYWVFEAPGHWTWVSVVAALIVLAPICIQIYTLYRALQIADQMEREYTRTVRWFVGSVVAMLVAVALAGVILASEPAPGLPLR
jgi:uncharacterized membrane protein YidH (DUF202 family)